jgi:hypothetical protein
MAEEVDVEVLELDGVRVDPGAAVARLRVADRGLVERLIDSVQKAMAPAAAFRVCYVDGKRDDGVTLDGISFTSRVLRRNLEKVGRVFPFVLTAGRGLDELIAANGEMLEKYLLDEIGNMALREARARFERELRSRFALETISCMAPGSLAEWPIEEQAPLFRLLPGVEAAIGVQLTESFLMLPRKSVSGIYFPSEGTFFSCQLCPRERCEGRKARFDPDKARTFGLSPDREVS